MHMHRYLALFNHLISLGDRKGDRYHLAELSAWYDYDGYTCYLGYQDLTMTIYFHNKYAYDYQDKQTLSSFEKMVEQYHVSNQLPT